MRHPRPRDSFRRVPEVGVREESEECEEDERGDDGQLYRWHCGAGSGVWWGWVILEPGEELAVDEFGGRLLMR